MDHRVAIVDTAGWGLVTRDEYRAEIEHLVWLFERASTAERRFAVVVAADAEEAAAWLAGRGSAIFVSRADFDAAQGLAERCPGVRVVLVTGYVRGLPPIRTPNFSVREKAADAGGESLIPPAAG